MVKRSIDPWQWQAERGYAQAVEVSQVASTLYVAGQTAIDAAGQSSTADMKTQVEQAIQNLEQVILAAGYNCGNIVRLTVYTTSTAEFMDCFGVYTAWLAKHQAEPAATLLEVQCLFESLRVELEATVVK